MSHRLLPFSPARYHGKPTSRPYFEGWYFKQTSASGSLVVIPGVYRGTCNSEDLAFIQLTFGSALKSYFLTYPVSEFSCHPHRFELCIGGNCFTENEMNLSMPEIGLKAFLKYSSHVPLKTTLASPSIMGPFSYLPKMQCNHGVLSLWHSVSGKASLDNDMLAFVDADGYIEKDWGEAFPESWIWMQCGHGGDALMCAIACIPINKIRFTGLICVLKAGGMQYRFATYNGGKIFGIRRGDSGLTVELKRGKYRLCIIASNATFGSLIAPSKLGMNREIQESVNCTYDVSICHDTDTIYSGHFEHGGLEMLNPEMLMNKKKMALSISLING
jgi:hypothetical protein